MTLTREEQKSILRMVMESHQGVTLSEANTLLDNMIQVFQDDEEYEKCHICLQIKNGIND